MLLVGGPWGRQHCPLVPPQLSCSLPQQLSTGIILFAARLLGGQLGLERGFLTGVGAYF